MRTAWGPLWLLCFVLCLSTGSLRADQGSLDFSRHNWQTQDLVSLGGPWYFLSEQFLDEAAIRSGQWKTSAVPQLKLPHAIPGPQSQPDAPGWGTLVIELKDFRPPFAEMGLRLRADTALHLFWLDQRSDAPWEQILKIGTPAALRERSIPQISDEVARIRTNGSGHYYLVAHISGHYYTASSIWTEPLLGAYQPVLQTVRRQQTLEALVCGMIFIMGVYYISMFFHQRENTASLLLAAFTFMNLLRLIATSPNMSLSFFPNSSVLLYELIRKGEFGFLMLISSTGFLFAVRSLLLSKLEALGRWMVYISGLVTLFCLVTTVEVYQRFLLIMNLFLLLTIVVSVGVAAYAVHKQRVGSVALLVGAVIMLVTSLIDVAAGLGVINSPIFYAPFGFAIFIFCQGQVISRLFSKAFRTAQRLSTHLQTEVDRQTSEIRTMLNSIPQGVMSFVEGNVADGSFSEHMKSILQEDRIEGRTLDELLLRRCVLSADQRDRIDATISASIGTEIWNFEANAEQLPHELVMKFGDKKKILEATWNPVMDKDDQVRKILVTLHDVTEARAREQEAEQQKIEFLYIQEIVSVSQEKFDRFMGSTRDFIAENIRLIEANPIKNMDAVKILFVNMHTIKGAARTLGLKMMTDVLHEVEQYYADLLKTSDLAWDHERLRRDITRAKESVEHYRDISERVLGRVPRGDNVVTLSRRILELQVKLLSQLPLDTIDEVLRQPLLEAKEMLKEALYLSLPAVMDDLLQNTGKLARDLGKLTPHVELNLVDCYVTQTCVKVLHHVFSHILRNALDHGIEAPDIREAAGKPKQGLLRIEASLVAEGLEMRVTDDGQGLRLHKLREKGIELGLIASTQELSPLQTAELVFHGGLSTAETVSQFSGRGVGMDAVRRYLEAVGGAVWLELESVTLAGGGHPFSLVLRLPHDLVYSRNESLRAS